MKNLIIVVTILLSFFLFFVASCKTQSLVKSMMNTANQVSDAPPKLVNICGDKINYAPDEQYPEHTPTRYVRVNFHIINTLDRKLNLEESVAKEYVKVLVDSTNALLRNNEEMFLPKPNSTPALPMQFQYVLAGDGPQDDGIYFHYDDDMAYINSARKATDATHSIFSSKQYDKYGVRKGDVLNIFLLEHHPDSVANKNKKKYRKINGVGTPRWVKVADSKRRYNKYTKDFKKDAKIGTPVSRLAQYMSKFLNHEIGHSLGLLHTWSTNDGCDDTPKHPNCWFMDENHPKCNTWDNVSNNVMDYNAFMKAYTPCQLGKIHYNFAKPNSKQRSLLRPDWCKYQANKKVTIKRDVVWNDAKDFLGDIVVENNATLTINCMVSLPKGAKIIVKPKAKLNVGTDGHLTNRCEDVWAGIEIWEDKDTKGVVKFANGASVSNLSNIPNTPSSSSPNKAAISNKKAPSKKATPSKSKTPTKPKSNKQRIPTKP